MSLRHAVLAALIEGGASGYELAKRFNIAVADYWSATPQQLYRDHDRLEADGLVEARVVEQTRRPNKRVFTLTAAGRDELRAYVREPARPPAIRDEFLVKLQALDPGDPTAILPAVRARLARSEEKLAHYDRLRDKALGGRTEEEFLRDSGRPGPYLTLMAGRLYEEMYIAWATKVLAVLTHRADADGSPSPAPDPHG